MNKMRVNLENVKISFANIYEPKEYNGVSKFSANFLIEKSDAEQINYVKTQMKNLASYVFKNKIPKFSEDNTCVKDGDKKTWKSYSNCFFISSSSKFKTVCQDIYLEECMDIKDGDIVNATVDFWIQNNEHGIRINATLVGVQKIKSPVEKILVAATSTSKLYRETPNVFTPKIKNLDVIDWEAITRKAEIKEKDIQDALDNAEIEEVFGFKRSVKNV